MSPLAVAPEISPRLTRLLAFSCLLAAMVLPALVAISWVRSPEPSYWARDIGAPPADHLRLLGGAMAVIPSLIFARGLYFAASCVSRFGRGELFSAGAVADLKGFARWSFFGAVAGVIAPTLIGLALTILNPAGMRELTISVESQEIIGLLTSGIFWIVAGVLGQAVQVADENRQFV